MSILLLIGKLCATLRKHSLINSRDCTCLNIMMDPKPMFPDMYHPTRILRKRDASGWARYHTRTARPTRYYIIDFGISRKYSPSDAPFLEDIIESGDRTVPEHREPWDPCNPFPTDVYCLGHAIKEKILEVCLPPNSVPL